MKFLAWFAACLSFAVSSTVCAESDAGVDIKASIENVERLPANRDRDAARKPAAVLTFIGLQGGDVVLDFGAGGGYWTELFSPLVGANGKIYAHQRPGERFESQKAAMTEQFAPFGNIELLPLGVGDALPFAEESVDAIMLSYILHHLHFSKDSPGELPATSVAVLTEFLRVLRPGGSFTVIEHASVDGSSRAESADWHRVPPAMATSDITGIGFEFVDEAPNLFKNPDDNLGNVWYETGLSGKTTSFVHKYRKPK